MRTLNKKWMGIAVCLLLAACMLAGCAGGSKLAACFDKDTVLEKAKEDIALAEGNDYEGWAGRFGEELRPQLTEEVYNQYLETVKALGTFQEFGKSAVVGQEQDGKNYAGVVIEAKYSEKKLKYVVTYDEDMNLVQFVIQ